MGAIVTQHSHDEGILAVSEHGHAFVDLNTKIRNRVLVNITTMGLEPYEFVMCLPNLLYSPLGDGSTIFVHIHDIHTKSVS